jgi:hypothetical protein
MKLFKEVMFGRKVYLGQIVNNIYTRNVRDVHKFEFTKDDGNVYVGWSIDKEAFEQHILPSCSQLIIRNLDGGLLYQCNAKKFLSLATLVRNRYVLEEGRWDVKEDEPALHGTNKIFTEED